MSSPRFITALTVEAYKLQRSLALLLVAIAPTLIAVFIFFSILRQERAVPWAQSLQGAAAIWAFFMLPMSVTALAALLAHMEHGPRSWDHLRALALPRWHLYAAKALCMLVLVFAMTLAVAMLTVAVVELAGWLKPVVAAPDTPELGRWLYLLGRIFLSGCLLVAVQLWIALRFSSFVPVLAVGIGGTFFAVVATGAKIGVVLPWQIPVNQLVTSPEWRAPLALALGVIGGGVVIILMVWWESRREVK